MGALFSLQNNFITFFFSFYFSMSFLRTASAGFSLPSLVSNVFELLVIAEEIVANDDIDDLDRNEKLVCVLV